MSVNTSERSSLSQEQTRFSGPGFSSFTPRSLGNIPAVAMQRIFKPQWPDPERSIGDEYTPLISKTRTMKRCWAARGPAADAFAEICPELESLLNYRDDLDDQEDQSQIWAFTCCMIGRHQGRARPSIILHCRQTSICQKAIGIIMETKWWKSFKQKYPAFTFTIRSCAPRPIELADEVTLSNFQGLAGDVFAPGFKQSASNCCGLPIFILLPDGNSSSNQRLKSPDRNSSSLYRQATMGGIVRVGNELRGLTVAHSFHILSQDDAIIDEEEEVTFFDDESEDEAIDATSIDSIMGDVDKKDDADQVKGQGKNKPRTRSSKLGSQSSESSANSNPDTSIFTTLPDFDAPRLGRLVESSYQHANNTLDWAIFSIERPLDIDSNFVLNTGRQPFRLKRIVEIAPSSDSCWRQSQDVCVAKKENEIVTGRMACAKFFLRLPGRPGFAETRQLLLSEPLARGDCGSWVIDPTGGALYGHIVAGLPKSRLAYMVPAYQIQEDISKRCGATVELPKQSGTLSNKIESEGTKQKAQSETWHGEVSPEPVLARSPSSLRIPPIQCFLPGDDISLEVIKLDICRYLGNEAFVRPDQGRGGYWIFAYRALTSDMIADLKADSARWQVEAKQGDHTLINSGYRGSRTHEVRQYYEPTSAHQTSIWSPMTRYLSEPQNSPAIPAYGAQPGTSPYAYPAQAQPYPAQAQPGYMGGSPTSPLGSRAFSNNSVDSAYGRSQAYNAADPLSYGAAHPTQAHSSPSSPGASSISQYPTTSWQYQPTPLQIYPASMQIYPPTSQQYPTTSSSDASARLKREASSKSRGPIEKTEGEQFRQAPADRLMREASSKSRGPIEKPEGEQVRKALSDKSWK